MGTCVALHPRNPSLAVHLRHTNLESRLEAVSRLVESMEQKMREDGYGNARSSKVAHSIVFVNRKRDADMVADAIEQQA